MSMEMGGGGSGGGGGATVAGGGGIDPSNLHLKKELTQIRKAARVLKDPGTSSTWRSPINTARSLTKHHYVHHHKNGQIDGNKIASSSEQFMTNNYSNGNGCSDKGNVNVKEKERRVFLYNWRSQKSESEISKHIGEDDVDKEEGSFSSVDVDSLSDARNGGGNDSKSDTYLSDRYTSAIFKCTNTDFTPSIRRTIKKKPKRSNYSSASLVHHNEKLRKQIILSRCAKNVVEGLPGLGLGREDLGSLVDQSDDTEDYCNSEDLRRASTLSPLLARLKNKSWSHSPAKLLRNSRKEDDSITYSTPALSTSSYNKYGIRTNPSIVESWDATTGSFNDADDEVDDHLDLPGRQGCGIPCYWSKRSTPKSRGGYGSSCSPSLSDTLRRKGSSIFCGTHQRRHHRMSISSNKRRMNYRGTGQSVPLLTNRGGSSICSGNSDDEISTNFGELDLEALSRLDGRRWSSSCRSQDGLELVALNGLESSPENVRSLSHKYRPMFFEEVIGQNIVVQSLMSAISRKRVAPLYLFQGPRGTGKTSTARVFAAALNCLATEETKPCGVCRECADFVSGKNKNLVEVDGSNRTGIEKIKNLLKSLSVVNHPSPVLQFKVFVVDECHLLPSKTWLTFLRLLEKPLPHIVFILVTTDVDNVPRAILSRCQKHLFNKISNGDIVTRLRKIANDENLDVESDALELIASNADGSLRDAETMIDQLSLFGKRITISLVNELIGVVSDEKLLELLELAMSSNATETVIRARELMDSGVDPIVLMSQMATLIVDIIAGTYPIVDAKHDSFFGGRSLSERELDRLKHALSLLSEAEKHLRVSSERSTWFTATLLQLGSMPSPDRTHSGSSRRQSSKATEDDNVIMLRADTQSAREKSGSPKSFPKGSFDSNPNNQSQFVGGDVSTILIDDGKSGRTNLRWMNSKMLMNVWIECIEKCHSKTLRQLLHSYGRLVSISEVKGGFIAHIAFGDQYIKTRAEGFLSSITNSFEIVLRRNVEVKIILLPDSLPQNQTDKKIVMNPETKSMRSISADLDLQMENANTGTSKEMKSNIPVQRIESIIREQRLETAWLQAMEKGTPGTMSRLKPERNQVLPQDGSYNSYELEPVNLTELPLQQQWEDELNHEIKALKINDGRTVAPQKDQIAKRAEHYPISPSLLHNSSFVSNFSKDNIPKKTEKGNLLRSYLARYRDTNRGQERAVAAGCSVGITPDLTGGEFQAKHGTPIRARKSGRFSWFGECAKSRRPDSSYNR
ncbi:hypothetical protein BUALT_Bualt19G0082900 [Buddleja alternifolia]|uniref:AAA+ ATPase domain-containing protein n=1 Tax=Buddleja alternifolia TaxID=168488 RepID=A0AAV6W818_9LAMI|nr:hypothetical protein BUALT_Bualt19G0082900 [Buddleja alternifolia]